jgi:hypothetical protein
MRTETCAIALAIAASVAGVAIPLSGCRRTPEKNACQRADDGSVVACVDGVAIGPAQVAEFVEETWWVPGSSVRPDPRKLAVDKAIRSVLFGTEAKRRRLSLPAGAPNTPGSWMQTLVRDEMTKKNVSRDTIGDDEAKKYFEDNKEQFHQLDELKVQVIVVPDGPTGEKIFAEVAHADADAFAAVAKNSSIDEKTKSSGGERVVLAADDEDREVLKMALTLRKPGAIGGPFLGSDQRWYVMRIASAPIEHPKPLDATLMLTVKNALVDLRRKELIDALTASLRAQAKIEVFDDALAKVPVPAGK